MSRTPFLAGALLVMISSGATAQVPTPQADPAAPNLFYGATPPDSTNSPILVFVHGLHGTASDWWGANDMYQFAFQSRYRTAFVSLSADNTPNDAGLEDNAEMLRSLLPRIALHFNGEQFYVIGHSKGGLDVQAALLFPEIRPLVKGVFTISAPNQGTELADWAFGPGRDIAGRFNLLTPGVFAVQTDRIAQFRAGADPVLQASGIPFYTMAGDSFLGNVVTGTTGTILRQLAPGQRNDGLVTVERSRLPASYSVDLDTFHQNHFLTDNGIVSFSRLHSVIAGLETTLAQFRRVATNGLGDPSNTWIWSMKWYKGALYVGTGRETHCVSLATAQALSGIAAYTLGIATGDCPADFGEFTRSLGAEIWRFQPETGHWTRVFKSPSEIPLGQDPAGNPVMLGRDLGFRGMEIFTEADGTEAMYVATVSAGFLFGGLPPYNTTGFPPPRLLRTTDGSNWAPVPQAPGTFLGEIARPRPGSTRNQWSFRALTSYRGKLFATVADYRGVGMIVASENPSEGNDAWFPVSPIPEEFPVWNLTVFNDFLYVTTGDQELDNNGGTGLYKTDASGAPPYVFQPVIPDGGFQPDSRLRSSAGLSFMEFKGQLFLGTNRPTELYRINPDDTWDLIVGEPRMTPQGLKTPLSGLGIGFGTWFVGHFWRMGVQGDYLFLGTWDWSAQLRGFTAFDRVFDDQYGFDLLRTADGIHWTAVSRNGMGDPVNYGGRSFEATPYGLFFGTARTSGGGEIFQCLTPTCEAAPAAIQPPALLKAQSESVAGRTATISWQPVPGAVKYHVYRATVQPIGYFLANGANLSLPIPGTDQVITLDAINSGQYDALCAAATSNTLCEGVNVVRDAAAINSAASFPLPWAEIAVTDQLMYSEPAPSTMQSLYYVTAEDAQGNISTPSNFVGAPSKALPSAPPAITAQLTPEPNAAGWNNTPVTVSWSVEADSNDILTSETCATVTVNADTAGTLLTCEAGTASGARAVNTVLVKIDTVPPDITGSRSPLANAAGWNNTDVTVAFNATDALSGLATVSPPATVAGEGAGLIASGTAVDRAGNAATVSVTVNIDRTPPEALVRFNAATLATTVVGTDALSGTGAGSTKTTVLDARGRQRSYLIADLAGNTLQAVLGFDGAERGKQSHARIQTLQYNGGPTQPVVRNSVKFEASVAKGGGLKELEQHVEIHAPRSEKQEASGKYEGRKNHTRLKLHLARRAHPSQPVLPGLVLLQIATSHGELSINY